MEWTPPRRHRNVPRWGYINLTTRKERPWTRLASLTGGRWRGLAPVQRDPGTSRWRRSSSSLITSWISMLGSPIPAFPRWTRSLSTRLERRSASTSRRRTRRIWRTCAVSPSIWASAASELTALRPRGTRSAVPGTGGCAALRFRPDPVRRRSGIRYRPDDRPPAGARVRGNVAGIARRQRAIAHGIDDRTADRIRARRCGGRSSRGRDGS